MVSAASAAVRKVAQDEVDSDQGDAENALSGSSRQEQWREKRSDATALLYCVGIQSDKASKQLLAEAALQLCTPEQEFYARLWLLREHEISLSGYDLAGMARKILPQGQANQPWLDELQPHERVGCAMELAVRLAQVDLIDESRILWEKTHQFIRLPQFNRGYDPFGDTRTSNLAELDAKILALWREVPGVDSFKCYESIRNIVFLPDNPNKAELHSSVEGEDQGSYFEPHERDRELDWLGMHLVYWAVRAEKVEELRLLAVERIEFPEAAAAALAVLITIELEQDGDLVALAEGIVSQPEPLLGKESHDTLLRICTALVLQLDEDTVSEESREVALRLVQVMVSKEQDTHGGRKTEAFFSKFLRPRTERAIAAEDLPALQADLKFLAASSKDYWAERFHAQAVHDAMVAWLPAGRTDLADWPVQQLLNPRLYSQYQAIFRSPDLVSPWRRSGRAILALPAKERFELFWEPISDLPDLGIRHARILDLDPERGWPHRLGPANLSSVPRESLCLFEVLIQDALTLGQEQLVLDRIEEIQQASSHTARLATSLFQRASGKEIDLGPYLVEVDGDQRFMPFPVEPLEVWPIELDLVAAALSSKESRDAGLVYLQSLRRRCRVLGRDFYSQQLAMLQRLQLLEHGSGFPNQLAGYRYEAPRRYGGMGENAAGWQESSGGIACSFSHGESKQYLERPIAGDFTVRFTMLSQGPEGTSGFAYAGLECMLDRQLNLLSFTELDQPAVVLEYVDQHLFEIEVHEGEWMSVRVDGKEVLSKARLPRPETPFFSWSHDGEHSVQFTDIEVAGGSVLTSQSLVNPDEGQ